MASDVLKASALSDEQIEQLIQEAEDRARARASAPTQPEAEDELTLQDETLDFSKRKPIPKLKHGLERQSYIQEKNGVAHIKPELLATKEQQTLADHLRKLEGKKQSKKNVCALYFHRNMCILYEEIISHFPLDADQQLFLICPASMRAKS